MGMIRTGETICAPATGVGGALAVIRISGSQSISICEKIFFPLDKNIKLNDHKGFTIVYGDIRSGDEITDDVLVSVFRAPHSYTGENSVEISCHASPFIIKKILELLILNGAIPGGVYTTGFYEWKDGSVTGRGSCRHHSLNNQFSAQSCNKSDAGWIFSRDRKAQVGAS
jgi:hypothetical protein